MPDDLALRIAALYPDDRAVLVAVLEAIEARELVAKARAVLGVRSSSDDAGPESPSADMPSGFAPILLGARASQERPVAERRYKMISDRRVYLCEHVSPDGQRCENRQYKHGRCKRHAGM
jgi:hypothetical protein